MAGRRLSGEAFAGEVTDVVMAYSGGKRPSPRPLVTVRTEDRPHLAERVKLYRLAGDGEPQTGGVRRGRRARGGPRRARRRLAAFVIRLTGEMGRGKEPEPGSVPEQGDRVCLTLFEHAPRGGPKLPDPERRPGPTAARRASRDAPEQAPDPVTEEDYL